MSSSDLPESGTSVSSLPPAGRWRRHRWTLLKLAVSLGLVVVVAHLYDLSGLAARLHSVRIVPALLCVAALFLQILLVALRWHQVADACVVAVTWPRLLRLVFVGQFFNQLLPSTVGGDAVKGWLLFRDGVPLRRVMASVIVDRIVGVLGLLLLVALALQTSPAAALPAAVSLSLLAVLAGGLIGTALLLYLPTLVARRELRWPPLTFFVELAAALRNALSGLRAARLLSIALAIHACSIAAAAYAAQAVGLTLELGILFVIFPITLLSATVPIAIGGWGLREGVMVGLLTRYAVPADGALALSIVFGVALALASLPGAALWFGGRRDRRADQSEIEQTWQNSASPTKE